jgi:hypothetical protein
MNARIAKEGATRLQLPKTRAPSARQATFALKHQKLPLNAGALLFSALKGSMRLRQHKEGGTQSGVQTKQLECKKTSASPVSCECANLLHLRVNFSNTILAASPVEKQLARDQASAMRARPRAPHAHRASTSTSQPPLKSARTAPRESTRVRVRAHQATARAVGRGSTRVTELRTA